MHRSLRCLSVTVLVAAMTAVGLASGGAQAAQPVLPFGKLAAGFTQKLYATGFGTNPFGIAFATNGDPIAASSGTLKRVDSHSTVTIHGSVVHPIRTLPNSNGQDGIANTADGDLYVSWASTTGRPGKINPATGATLAAASNAPLGNLGITVDPVTGSLLYASRAGVAFVSADLSGSGMFAPNVPAVGLTFDPTGQYLFVTDGADVAVFDRNGKALQLIFATGNSGSSFESVAFHVGSPDFLVTSNEDGTMTRIDFPNGDYTKAPTQSVFASGGSPSARRGMGYLTDVGADGCLYVSQSHTKFADGTTSSAGSIVQICGGFIPPNPTKTTLAANPYLLHGPPAATVYLTPSATLTLTGSGHSAPGEMITFTANHQVLCTATTDSTGFAACTGTEPVKGRETTSHADWMTASRLGSLIQAMVGSLGGSGRRCRNRAGFSS